MLEIIRPPEGLIEDLRPGDTEKRFIRGASAPKSSHLPIYIPFLIEEVPYTFHRQMVSPFNLPTLELFISLSCKE